MSRLMGGDTGFVACPLAIDDDEPLTDIIEGLRDIVAELQLDPIM